MSQDNIRLLWTADDMKFFEEACAFMKDNVEEQLFYMADESNNVSPFWSVKIVDVIIALHRLEEDMKLLKEDDCGTVDTDRIEDIYDNARDLARLSKREVFLPEFGWQIESECNELQSRLLNLKHAG